MEPITYLLPIASGLKCVFDICLNSCSRGIVRFEVEDKSLFDKFYRNLLDGENEQFPMPEKLKSMKQIQFPKKDTVFDWICTKQGSDTWISWTQIINNNSTMIAQAEEIFVHTEETANLLYFIRLLLQNQEPILIIGPQGCGKTRTLLHQLQQQSVDRYIVNFINLSSHVNANRIQKKAMAKTDRRRKGVYGPPMGKKIILAFDDFETAIGHKTGQSVIELLRQFLEYRFWYNLEDLCRIELVDCIFAGILTETENSTNISSRFLHHVNLVHAKSLTEVSVSTIFTKMLDFHFENEGFSSHVQSFTQGLVSATLEVYKRARSLLTVRLKMPEYFIDLKDLHRVFTGMSLMNGQFCQGVDELFRLWVHEMMRVFGDKLQNDEERESILSVIKSSSCHYLRQRTEQYTSHLIPESENTISVPDLRKLCFSNFSVNGIRAYDEASVQNPALIEFRRNSGVWLNIRTYSGGLLWKHEKNVLPARNFWLSLEVANFGEMKIPSMETLTKQMCEFVEKYNSQNKKSVSCAIFRFVVECICIVLRALQKDTGHLFVVRSPGSGTRTILQLAALILGLKVTEVKASSRYGIERWRTDLKEILWESGIQNTPSLLILPVDNIDDDDMLDDINTLLNTSDLSDIFSSEERSNISTKIMDISHEECQIIDLPGDKRERKSERYNFIKLIAGLKIDTTPTTLYRFFIARIRTNLHIAIMANPMSSVFYDRLHTCPSFLKCCAVYWFGSWPDDALQDSASVLLRENSIFTVNTELLDKCAQLCKQIHKAAIDNVTRCNNKFEGQFYVTPEMFIKFLQMFRVLYKNKIEEISAKQNRYQQGLEKLNFTANQVTSMQAELQILKPKLLETSDSTEKLMVKIEQNTVKMEAVKEIVAADEALANEAAAAAQAIRDDCESDLSEAEPALISATNALDTLNSSDITVIKAMKNPPTIVKLVLESVCVMKGMKAESHTDVAGNTMDDFWPTSLKLLGDAKFLENLKSYDKENINPQIISVIRERFITHPDFEPDIVKKVSNACEGLCKWVRAMEVYDRVIKIVKPKKIKLANAEAGYASQMEKLNEKRTQLTKVMSKLQVLHDEWAEKTKQKKELEDSIEICSLKLDRAGKLLESLRYEKERWQKLEAELNKDLNRSIGDIFLSSAFITYLTIFRPEFRNEIVSDWYRICQETQLPITKNYSFSSTFITSDDIKYWNMAGLQTDAVSVDNYIVISKTTKLPFIIDPQGQAKEYIKYLENDNHLKILKASDKKLFVELKEALVQSTPVLIEEVFSELDHILIPLMKPEYIIVDEKTYLKLNDEDIACDHLPKIYMTTVQQNEDLCDVYNHATLIDFEINPEQLRNRLLKIMVSIDAPELESRHMNWLLKCAEDCQSLCQTEDKILKVLSSTDGNILEDETALQTLNDSKDLLEEIRVKQSQSSLTEMNLKQEYAPFEKISNLGTRIFFAIIKLRQLNSFYEFSFDWFIGLLHQATKKSEKCEQLEKRISFVCDYFIKSVHNELEQILDEKCLLVAQFFICVQMISEEDCFEIGEKNIFSDNLWTAASPGWGEGEETYTGTQAALINSFHPSDPIKSILVDEFTDYNFAILELKKWLRHFQEQNIIPSTLSDALGSKDFIPLIQEFVTRKFQANDDLLDLYDVYHNSDDRIPFICSFTHFDVDPLNEILSLASEIGLPDNSIKCVPFSKTRERTELEKIIVEALKEGNWIVIHDFHLLKYAADDMVSLLNQISAVSDVHSQFKLWIVTFLDEELPVAILLKGIKITIKDKKYLGPMLHQLYSFTSVHMPQLFENQKLNRKWNFHFFLVCFCHAMLKTVQSHGNFFLEKSCDFTKMNFRSSCSFLELFFVNSEQDTFIEDFIYLLSECNYGANISGRTDQLMLNTIFRSFKVEKSDRPSYVEILDVRFTIPQDMSFNACIRFIQSLPKTNLLEESNLHHLLTLEQIQTTTDLWKLARKLYCFNERKDENFIELLKNDMFLALTVLNQFGDFIGSRKNFINIYLSQEIALYRTLVQSIIGTLKRRKNEQNKSSAVKKMNAVLQKLQNNEIPSFWSTSSYPFKNLLKIYILNLNRRLVFLNKWIHFGQPETIWLSGLFNVLGFLTSVKYSFSKHHHAFLSDVSLYAEVTDFDEDAITSKEWNIFQHERKTQNPFGVFVQGLILVGGLWNREKLTIDALAHENYCHVLPIVWIAPELRQKYDIDKDLYPCPLYYTQQTGSRQLQFRFPNYITRVYLTNLVRADRTIAQQGIRFMLYSD